MDALPVATWGAAWHGAGFTLHPLKDGWRLWVRTTIFAEVIVAAGWGGLTVCGLTYLRELDGSSDPVKAGFTGL